MIVLIDLCTRLIKWLSQALIIQLFLLSLSFPVLVAWGIAFSPLVFAGNILFTPFLTFFLALSCIIYIFEFLYIPTGFLCSALDLLAQAWMFVMSWAPNIALIACPTAPFWVLLIMPLGSWGILRTLGLKNHLKTASFLILWVLLVFSCIKWYFTPENREVPVACGSRHITLKKCQKAIVLIDTESVLQTRACSQSWVDYTLSSQLVKTFGSTTIDAIIIQKGTPGTLKRAAALCQKYRCKKVYDVQGLKLQI